MNVDIYKFNEILLTINEGNKKQEMKLKGKETEIQPGLEPGSSKLRSVGHSCY